MTNQELQRERLVAWLGDQIPDADEVRIDSLDRIELGHSAEMLLLTLVVRRGSNELLRDVVVRLRPPFPGLLEPYDLGRQFRILRALEPTAVRSPRALWHEPSGDVLGRELYVMERSPGDVYERELPPDLESDPTLVARMCEGIVDQLVEIHGVDLAATGLDQLGGGATQVDRQLAHWSSEMRRVQRGPLPALERLYEELVNQRPEPSDRITLLHGDAKPGNFAFVGAAVSAVFDWEMTDIGDPLTDVGYLELMWDYPVGLPTLPTAPSIDDLLARYEERSGITVEHRAWYRSLQAYKASVIMLVGAMLFETGDSDDMRYLKMSLGIDMTTQPALRDLGVGDTLDAGPVIPSDERIEQAQARAAHAPDR